MASSFSAFVYNTLKAPSIDGVTGAIDLNTGKAIASASTINLNTATGNRVHITGTTAITAVTLTRGPRTVIFDGVLTLTHNATTNNLPGAANITTAAGDRAIYDSDGTTVYCVSYIKANGTATVVAASASAMTLLSTVTVSSLTATVDIETTFNSTYDLYMLAISRVRLETGGRRLRCRMKLNGTYQTATYYSGVTWLKANGIIYDATSAYNDSSLIISAELSPSAGETFDTRIYLTNPSSSTEYKKMTWSGTANTGGVAGTGTATMLGSGTMTDTTIGLTPLTGLRFFASTDNISQGTFRLYGISN